MTHPASETLTVECKSDRERLPDDDLIEAVVCLANAEAWPKAEIVQQAVGQFVRQAAARLPHEEA